MPVAGSVGQITSESRRLIEWFDSWFDVRLEHDLCLRLLREQGVLTLSDADPYSALVHYVGYCWCQMIKFDVLYELRQGALVRDQSQIVCRLLGKWTDQRLRSSEGPFDIERFGMNVLARWHDGAGKIHYRNKEYTDARIMFENAVQWAERGKLWFLASDLRSNLIRADFEEQRTVGKQPEIGAQFESASASLLQLAQEYQVKTEVGQGDAEPFRVAPEHVAPDQGAPREEREFLRGLCSIWHNMSLAEQSKGKLDESLDHSQKSEAIAAALNDEYRLAQAVHHQGVVAAIRARAAQKEAENTTDPDLKQDLLRRGREQIDEALKHFNRVRMELDWRRGKLIAWQQSAKLLTDTSNSFPEVLEAIAELRKLLDFIRAGRAFASGEQSADLEIFNYTVQALRGAVNRLRNWSGDGKSRAKQEYDLLIEVVEEQELVLVRAVRSVVKVSSYKQDYNRQGLGVYEHNIRKQLAAKQFTFAISFLEEASGRELLDVLALNALPGAESEQHSIAWSWNEGAWVPPRLAATSIGAALEQAANETEASVPRRHGLRRVEGVAVEKRQNYLRESIRAYENDALQNPISVTPHDPEIAQKVLDMSRRTRAFAMVRYVSFQDGTIGTFVIRNGKMRYQELDRALVKDACDLVLQSDPNAAGAVLAQPMVQPAMLLWRSLIEPVWRDVTAGGLPEHLVIVPHHKLFQLPLHLAMESETAFPLAARVPLSFSVSASMHLATGRYLCRWITTNHEDPLCAITALDGPRVSGSEICQTGWVSENIHILGDEPDCLFGHNPLGSISWDGIRLLGRIAPRFFVVACHGNYDPRDAMADLGPTLNFGLEIPYASQFDIALRLRLPGNAVTVLAACVSGQGAGAVGGDVAGFVRSFIAAGAGALGVTLFSVRDDEIASTVRYLLETSRSAVGQPSWDLVATLQQYYEDRCARLTEADRRLDACPLVIYL